MFRPWDPRGVSEEQWQAPGREHGQRPGPAAGGSPQPPQSRPPATPANPYVPSGPAPSSAFGTSERHRDQVLGGPGYHTPAYRNHPGAVAALVLGLVGILIPGVALFAIAAGHLALHRLKSSYEGGRGLAVAGLVLGYAMVALWLAGLVLTSVDGLGL